MSRNFKIGLFLTLAILTTTFTFYFWQMFRTPNLQVDKPESFVLYIPEGATFKTVTDTLKKHAVVNDAVTFAFVAKIRGYQDRVIPGRYVIRPDATNNEVIGKLSEGRQDAVRLTFNNIRLKSDLIARVGRKFEFGEQQLGAALNSPEICRKFGFDTLNIISMFIPNTYEIYWNTGVEKFLGRMHTEYKRFWNEERQAKAKAVGLSPDQVAVLASIVEEEQAKKADERPRVAGLYLNRLKSNMPLQADPTIKFALNDFGIKRILHNQLLVDSPYNTYLNTGLPPGPIRVPDIQSLDAVLNPEQHNFTYMCAKDDFSGYHAFADNYKDHLLNAQLYQQALNRLNIKK